MKARPILAAVLLCLAPPAAAAVGDEAPSPGQLRTEMTLFTGSPEPAPDGADGVLLVPGTVLPVDAGPAGEADVEASVERSRDVFDLVEKLAATLRLADLRPQYLVREDLALDRVVDLPPVTPGSTVRPRVTLLGRTDELATYRVAFVDGGETLSETSVSVPAGRRSIVGGLDGQEAPYVFLVLRPTPDAEGGGALAEGVTPPRRVEGPVPEYPEDARKERVEGMVVAQVVIDEAGRVSHARVLKGLHPSLDEETLETIRAWRFEPATRDGEPVEVFYNLVIRYLLDGGKPPQGS